MFGETSGYTDFLQLINIGNSPISQPTKMLHYVKVLYANNYAKQILSINIYL